MTGQCKCKENVYSQGSLNCEGNKYKSHIVELWFFNSKISVCNELNGGCNLHGTKGCTANRENCTCRPLYMGENCQYCTSDEYVVSGENGMKLDKTGHGVECGK